jgi:AhpD family alkylhydroperoxidase
MTIAPAGTKALRGVHGYIAESALPSSLVNLVYLRVSQINGCAYCIDMHSRDLIKEGFAIEKLVLVQAWREAGGLFDARERAALAWAETVTRSPTPLCLTMNSWRLRPYSPRRNWPI